MNSKLILGAAVALTLGVTGCDSRNSVRDAGSTNVDQSASRSAFDTSATSPGTANTITTDENQIGQNATDTANEAATTSGTSNAVGSTEGTSDFQQNQPERDRQAREGKVSPDHAREGAAAGAATSGSHSGASSDSTSQQDISSGTSLSNEDMAKDWEASSDDRHVWTEPDRSEYVNEDGDLVSGTTRSDEAEVTYKQTPHRGGIAPEDRNLRFGLVGNGTGIGTEDTTSKYMTDNDTIADPLIRNSQIVQSGALSMPSEEQNALDDIRSGTTFDSEYYKIEE